MVFDMFHHSVAMWSYVKQENVYIMHLWQKSINWYVKPVLSGHCNERPTYEKDHIVTPRCGNFNYHTLPG